MSSGGASAGTMTQQQPQTNAIQQTNGAATGGKKVLSGGSSGGPTPAGTPVQNGNGQQGPSPPPLTNAPKYGTLVPNRIFVGGISASTTEGELMQLFSAYGTVKAAKIIQDRAGVSKGYGFITFESEDDARRPLRDPDSIVLRERRLNIAPAIKKQPFGRPPAAPPYDQQGQPDGRSPAPAQHQAMQPPLPPFFFGAAPPFYTGAAAYYATAPPGVPQMVSNAAAAQAQASQASQEQAAAAAQQAMYQGPPVYPAQTGPPQGNPYASMMFPQTIYMPQQYPMMPYDYTAVYSTGGAPPPSNGGGVPPQFASAGPPSGGGASPPRGPCYAPQPSGPPEATTTFLYGPPPPHHLFHPAALDPTGAPGPIYASADGGFDPMVGPHMGHFGGAMGAPYGMSEDGSASYLEHPDASHTPRSFLTATPPASEHRNTATPVVSVLALEQQQEKDPASMQGGRRPPPPPPVSLHQQQHQQQQSPQHHQQQQQMSMSPQQRRLPIPNGNRRPPFGRPINIQHTQQQQQQYHHPQPPSTASFVPPARRPRNKPQRRSNGAGPPSSATANEIGAGDAPLPQQHQQDGADGLVGQVEALKI